MKSLYTENVVTFLLYHSLYDESSWIHEYSTCIIINKESITYLSHLTVQSEITYKAFVIWKNSFKQKLYGTTEINCYIAYIIIPLTLYNFCLKYFLRKVDRKVDRKIREISSDKVRLFTLYVL